MQVWLQTLYCTSVFSVEHLFASLRSAICWLLDLVAVECVYVLVYEF